MAKQKGKVFYSDELFLAFDHCVWTRGADVLLFVDE
jgi:hypothetical protein